MEVTGYRTIADTARESGLSIQRVKRAIEVLAIETHRFGSTTLIPKNDLSRIIKAFRDGTIRRGRPKKGETSALRRSLEPR